MDELNARAVLVSPSEVGGGVTTSIPRREIEEVLAEEAAPIELVLDVARADGDSTETRTVAVSWERSELEELLRSAQGDDVVLTFDKEALSRAVDDDVEAHGIREKVLVLAVAATAATGVAASAAAEPGAFLGAGAPITQSLGPDDRAFARGGPVETPSLAPDDRAVPRGGPVEMPTPGVSPDDRAVPRGGPVETPSLSPDDRAFPRVAPVEAPTVGLSPDDRAVPRGGPVETPVTGTVSDGPSWAPTPSETGALIGALALVITGAYFIVGGHRRGRVRPA